MPYADPETARNYQREYRRLRRSGDQSTTPSTSRLPADFRVRKANDVMALLDEQIAIVREDPDAGTLEKARCIGYLAGVALKAIDAGDMAARVESLESVLKCRKSGNEKP